MSPSAGGGWAVNSLQSVICFPSPSLFPLSHIFSGFQLCPLFQLLFSKRNTNLLESLHCQSLPWYYAFHGQSKTTCVGVPPSESLHPDQGRVFGFSFLQLEPLLGFQLPIFGWIVGVTEIMHWWCQALEVTLVWLCSFTSPSVSVYTTSLAHEENLDSEACRLPSFG